VNLIAKSPDGAQAVVDAKVFGFLAELMKRHQILTAFRILEHLATHDFVLALIVDSKLIPQAISLLRRVRSPLLKVGADAHAGIMTSFFGMSRRHAP
jgi:hypothetical protein